MRGVYKAEIKISAFALAKTLILLEAPSTKVFQLLSAHVGNASNITNEQIEAALTRVTTKGAPAGTSITPVKSEVGDAASSATVLGNLTTEPTTYETGHLDRAGRSSLAGYDYLPTPEERDVVAPSGLMGVRILVAPTAFDLICVLRWLEMG